MQRFERQWSDLQFLSFFTKERLYTESVRGGGATDIDEAILATGFCIREFICCSTLVVTHSTVIASHALHWMNTSIGATKAFAESSFRQTL